MAPDNVRYFKLLFGYVLAERRMLALSVVFGILGLCLPFAFPLIIGSAIDRVVVPQPVDGRLPSMEERLRWLTLLTTAGAATAAAFAVVGYAKGHYTLMLGNLVVTRIRNDLFNHLQRLSLQFYAKERTGGLVWRIAHEVNGVNGIIYAGVLLFAFDVLQLLVAVFLLLSTSWQLAIAVLVAMPAYVAVFGRLNPRIQAASETVSRHMSQLSGNVQEQFSAMALVKTYAAEGREAERFMKDNAAHCRHLARQSHLGHLMGAASEMMIHVATTIIIGYGCYLALRGDPPLTAGDITRFLGYAGILYGPLKRFADLNFVFHNSLASVRRIFRVFDIEPKIKEHAHPVATPPPQGDVRYEGVRFCYIDDSDESRIRLDEDEPDNSPYRVAPGDSAPPASWVLDGIDLHVRAGERVALVGSSGGGKTTLVSLLPRLYDVQEGRILIDGVDVRDYSLAALRSAIAIVQQESFLFSGTIQENIAYGNPAASEAEIIAAARAAHAHGFISELPLGYRTELGERGVNLSGGQKQRLSIARAILRDPKILILDEATSALDTESEALVQQALDALMRNRTSLVIAHRLSTVRHADRIVVLENGRVVEMGTHESLLRINGPYARLVRHQFHRRQRIGS